MNKCNILSLILLLILTAPLSAGDPVPTRLAGLVNFSERLENGQVAGSVTSDTTGMVWTGTQNGVFCFDGHRFTRLQSADTLINNLLLKPISALNANDSSIWIGSKGGAIEYKLKTGVFKLYESNYKIPGNILTNHIECIEIDSHGIWFGNWYGISLLKNNGIFINFKLPKRNDNEYSQCVTAILCEGNDVWFSTWDGNLFHLNLVDSAVHKTNFSAVHSISPGKVTDIFRYSDEILWISTFDEGLLAFNQNSETTNHVVSPDVTSKRFLKVLIHNELYWLGTEEGIFLFEDNKLKRLTDPSILNTTVYDLYSDNQQNIWIGTANGLVAYNKLQKRIPGIPFSEANKLEPEYISESFFELPEGKIWFCSKGGNLIRDEKTGQFFSPRELGFNLPQGTVVFDFCEYNNIIYFAERDRISEYNPVKKSYSVLVKPEYFGFAKSKINNIIPVDHRNLLFQIEQQGIYLAEIVTGKITRILPNEKDQINYFTGNLYQDSKHNIWYIFDRYIYKFNHQHLYFEQIIIDENLLNPESALLDIQEHNDEILILTLEGSVLKYNTGLPDLKVITLNMNQSLKSFETDTLDNLWLNTKSGLYRYSLSDSSAILFTSNDGLLGNNIQSSALFKSSSGHIYLSNILGTNYFNPYDVRINNTPPTVYITGLYVNNENFSFENDRHQNTIRFLEKINLGHKQNYLYVQFSTLNFIHPHRNEYRFRLAGLEEEWNINKTGDARYLNLAPGNYQLMIYGSNNDGFSSKEPAILEISIAPPWYKTSMTKFFGILLITSLVFFIIYIRTRQSEIQKLELEKLVNSRTKELKIANENLLSKNQKILSQKEEIETIAEQLHESDQRQIRFFMNISHELRTPLTLIQGPLKLLLKKIQHIPTHKELADLALRNADRLLRLINQLLDLRLLQTGSMLLNISMHNIIQQLEEIKSTFDFSAENERIKFIFKSEFQELNAVYDQDILDKVMVNLLSNAFKYTNEDGTIILEAKKAIETDFPELGLKPIPNVQYLRISVIDSGPGMSTETINQVFERFYTNVNNKQKRVSGSGIGLSIVKELIELHEGAVSVKSEPGEGSAFSVIIPINQEVFKSPVKQHSYLPLSHNIQQLSGSKIEHEHTPVVWDEKPLLLVIDDDPDMLRFLKTELSEQFEIVLAENGKSGIEKAIDIIPDLIISDIMMPEMDGLEFCRQLKSNMAASHIPVILLTAKIGNESMLEGLETGADDYISKPFHTEILIAKINSLLINRQRLQMHYQNIDIKNKKQFKDTIEQEFITRLIKLIIDNITDDHLGADMLCSAMNISKTQLYRKLKAITGLSTNIFIRDVRLDKAMELLKTTNMNISEVAFNVGINNPGYFTRSFTEKYGKPPKSFSIGKK